jgi:hypothetical protein
MPQYGRIRGIPEDMDARQGRDSMRGLSAKAATVLSAWLFLVLVGHGAVAKVRQAPSSRVAIDLSEGYVPSRFFTGFINEGAGVSLVVVELPEAAYEQLAQGLTPEALAAKGITNGEAAKLSRPEPYLYMRGQQASGQGPIAKFIVAFRENGVAALITANVQRDALERGAVKAEEVERMLASASIAAVAAPARDVFRLTYLGPFKPAGSILGNTRAFTLDGRMEPLAPGEQRAVLIVAPSLDRRLVLNALQDAETLLAGLPGLQSIRIAERNRLRIAGMEAVELVGTATDKDGGGKVELWQVLVLPPDGGYFRLVGQIPKSERESLLPELRRIADSFRLVE